MLSSLFFLNSYGEVLIEKQFREKIPRNVLEDYWSTYMHPLRSLEEAASVVQYSRYAFIHILREGVVMLGVTTREIPPMMTIEILSMIHRKLAYYLKEMTEERLKENFSLVYQLLEELIDNGYPLTTEYHLLQELVPKPGIEAQLRSLLDKPKSNGARAAHEGGAISWRSPDIKYAANEMFFDCTEFMDVVVGAEGQVVRANIRGEIDCNCKLSGMPDVLVSLRNHELIEDIAYHRCVRHNRYESDRVLNFIPPDGPFRLLQYRTKNIPNLIPPFYVNPQVTFNKHSGRLNCMVGIRGGNLGLDKDKEVHKVVIRIPLPPHADVVKVSSISTGTYTFSQQSKVLTWKIGHLTMNSPSLSAEFSVKQSDEITENTGEPVSVEFQIPNHNISGVKIESVNVHENYKPYKGVKYMTRAGRFSVRTV